MCRTSSPQRNLRGPVASGIRCTPSCDSQTLPGFCGKGELEAVVTASTGRTGTGCWRVVGDAVYLTGINVLQDAMIPLSQFEGSPLPVGKMAGK